MRDMTFKKESCTISNVLLIIFEHRILHTSYLYKNVHKQHHEWTAPIGIGAAYAHPIEFAFGTCYTHLSSNLFYDIRLIGNYNRFILCL